MVANGRQLGSGAGGYEREGAGRDKAMHVVVLQEKLSGEFVGVEPRIHRFHRARFDFDRFLMMCRCFKVAARGPQY